GNRFVTNRKVLSEAGESMERFFATGVTELADRLGPIVWQFAPTKHFDPDDFAGFLELLPRSRDGIALRHVVEVRHDSFLDPDFVALARKHSVAICYAHHHVYPEIADVTADFVCAPLKRSQVDIPNAYTPANMKKWVKRAKTWARSGMPADLPLAEETAKLKAVPRYVCVYIMHEGKIRTPQAA